jgi:hypothetical protein
MRRAFCLSVLVVLLSCSEEGGDPRELGQVEDDPVTREDASDEDPQDPEDAGEDDRDAQEEEADSDTEAPPDAGAVDPGEGVDAAQASDAGQEVDASGEADAGEVACIDEQIAQLILFDAPAAGSITEEGTEPGTYSTLIDATAGGLTTTQSFVYARFTDGGLEKLPIGDEAAFASSSWHIAARRYVLRVNSGVGGPGTVRAARTEPGTTFEGLSAVPDGLIYRTEQYYTESCEFVPDTSGVGAPATALSSFWSYPGCVKMTSNVFVLELPEQHHVKLQVVSYYPPDNHQSCQETETITLPSGAGALRIRWAFLD